MITYVNSVFVSNIANATILSAAPANASSMDAASADAGKFIIMNCDPITAAADLYISTAAKAATAKRIKIGLVTSKNMAQYASDGTITYKPIVRWSNIINADDVRGINALTYQANSEDTITIDLKDLSAGVLSEFAEGGKRVIVRLTFKDTPTRFRKWTESYEYVTQAGDTKATIASGIASLINKEWKRARVTAAATTTAGSEKVVLTAMAYNDDNSVDSINWANKVRFNANIYWTDPAAEGWESKNKFFPTGVVITKQPGKQYAADAKLVRDRESQAMGYNGILNRGEGTWPIIKPEMNTDLSKHYNALTLEFENMYRAADDIFRKTKQTVEIYAVGALTTFKGVLDAFIDQEAPASNG